jgi:hypothetical protein
MLERFRGRKKMRSDLSDLVGPPVALALVLVVSVGVGLVLATAASWPGRPAWVGSGAASYSMHSAREAAEADRPRGSVAVGESVTEADDDGYVEDLTRILGNDASITGSVRRK